MRALHKAGFANIPTSRRADDGLRLMDAYIAAAVRCAPPGNKPTPAEIAACHAHLDAELAALPNVAVVVALGRIASDAYWRLMAGRGVRPIPRPAFGHGVIYVPRDRSVQALVNSYHPSRQNTNTGRLTPAMFDAVFRKARTLLRQV